MTTKPGTLYLCATPIGNLEDMTYRVVRVLNEVAVIAAEDTRHTRKLLSHFDIHTPLISYHEHNKIERGPELISRLLGGESVAVVSDAGMPGISDPGADLVVLAIAEGIIVVPIPGANAVLSALVCSGLDTTQFIFIGFLPVNKKKRRETIADFTKYTQTIVLYEAPHRIKATLSELQSALGDRVAVAGRELTKKFEEFVRGTLGSLQAHFEENLPRGEFTLVISGKAAPIEQEESVATLPELSLPEAVAVLVASGINKKDAIKRVAIERAIPKRDVYQAVIAQESE